MLFVSQIKGYFPTQRQKLLPHSFQFSSLKLHPLLLAPFFQPLSQVQVMHFLKGGLALFLEKIVQTTMPFFLLKNNREGYIFVLQASRVMHASHSRIAPSFDLSSKLFSRVQVSQYEGR